MIFETKALCLESGSDHCAFHLSTLYNMAVKLKACGTETIGGLELRTEPSILFGDNLHMKWRLMTAGFINSSPAVPWAQSRMRRINDYHYLCD